MTHCVHNCFSSFSPKPTVDSYQVRPATNQQSVPGEKTTYVHFLVQEKNEFSYTKETHTYVERIRSYKSKRKINGMKLIITLSARQ